MSRVARIARRVLFSVGSVYAVLTATFALVVFTPDNYLKGKLGVAAFSGMSPEEQQELRQTYLEARGRDEPLLQRYADYVGDVFTFDWGYSVTYEDQVSDLIVSHLPRTLEYVVPGVLLALVVGVLFGLYSATHRGGDRERTGRAGAYLLFGVPAFWAEAVVAVAIAGTATQLPEPGTGLSALLYYRVVPTLLVASSLAAAMLSFARAETLEYVGASFVKLLRSSGADDWTIRRHVLRNAAIPLFSLFATELVVVLVVNVYIIEVAFNIEGFGALAYTGIKRHEIPLVIGTTMVVAFAGILGNLVQDLTYTLFDPRVEGA